jgi:hypothetical protein
MPNVVKDVAGIQEWCDHFEGTLAVSFFIVCTFIHMCIHCLGHLKQSKKAVSYKIKYIFII